MSESKKVSFNQNSLLAKAVAKSADTVDPQKAIQYLSKTEYIQERFNLEILDAYHALNEEVRKGIYGYVFSEFSHRRSTDFLNMIHRNIHYNFYKYRGEYFDRNNEDYDSNSSEEVQFWGEKQNKFAYT